MHANKMNPVNNFVVLLFIFAAITEPLVAEQTNSPQNSATSKWAIWQIPEYNLEFKYPPEAGVKESKLIFFQHPAADGVSREPDGLCGYIAIDGLHQWPFSIKLSPEVTFWNGVVFRSPIRFIMLTDAAKMDPMWAKKYGWNEAPEISMYPFDYKQDKEPLLQAVERLYLGRPRNWLTVAPVTVDGNTGLKFSDWDTIMNERYFEDFVAVPIATNKILIIQAGYYPKSGGKSVLGLESKRQTFSDVVSSVKFYKR